MSVSFLFLEISGVVSAGGGQGSESGLSASHLQLLKRIVDQTTSRIILSSAYRWNTERRDEIDAMLQKEGLPALHSQLPTPSWAEGHYPLRGDEIIAWLAAWTQKEENKGAPFQYVVLDTRDVSGQKKELEGHAVRVDPAQGITAEKVEEAIAILKQDPQVYTFEPVALVKPSEKEINVQVYSPFSGVSKMVPPPETDSSEFYAITPQDAKQIMEQDKQRREENSTLRTKAMREQDNAKRTKQYHETYIRFRFPNRMEVQATFLPTDTTEHLNDFIKQQLAQPNLPFYLFTTPPPQPLKAKTTLKQQQLVPTATVHFGWKKGTTCDQYLKEGLMLRAQERNPFPLVKEESKEEVVPVAAPVKPAAKSGSKGVPSWFNKGKK